MKTGIIQGMYGSNHTSCTLLVCKTSDLIWYTVQGGSCVNATEQIDSFDVELLRDVDHFTTSSPLEEVEDLVREVNSHLLDELMGDLHGAKPLFFEEGALRALGITNVQLIGDVDGKVWLAEKGNHWSDMFGSEPKYTWHLRPVDKENLEFEPLVEVDGKLLLLDTWEEVEEWVSAHSD